MGRVFPQGGHPKSTILWSPDLSQGTFYRCLLWITGPESALAVFADKHLAAGVLTFNSMTPMPPELFFPMNNWAEDGYNALFGDWTKIKGYQFLKEAALSFSFPFPLASREQVIRCLTAIGEFGEERLRLGRLQQRNLERFGHGHYVAWREAHWGTSADAQDVIAEITSGHVAVSLLTLGVPTKKWLVGYSRMHPELVFRATYISENGKMPGQATYASGKLKDRLKMDPLEAQAVITSFRRSAGPHWLNACGVPKGALDLFEVSNAGTIFLRSGGSLGFYLNRIAAGESFESLQARFPYLTSEEVEAIRFLVPKWLPEHC